jgi:alginate O-acetyltransferase complex protein AlgI
MVFNSFNFLLFFSSFIAVYFLLNHKYRWMLLLAGSIIFYAFFNVYGILLFAGVIIFNYFSGIAIEKADNKKTPLILSCIFNIGCLFLFKYFNFFNSNLTELLKIIGVDNPVPFFNFIMPVGISYYIFQAIGYNLDVSREMQSAERHFGIFAAYFSFFPKVAQGPVERTRNLIPQFYEKHDFNYARVVSGLQLMTWGLFKKVVIADRLALFVNPVYDHTTSYSGYILILAGLFYTFQLYADFSGYTDIALGAAEVLGFKMLKNFDRPFSSKSVTEFWKRWHISFSTWLMEYLYNPLSILKRNWGKWGMVYAIMITFTISGVWHGVGWMFLFWGVINGIALSYEVLTVKFRKKLFKKIPIGLNKNISWAITFLFLCFSFSFSRNNNLSDGFHFITHLFQNPSPQADLYSLGLDHINFIVAVAAIIFMEIVQYYQSKGSVREMISRRPVMVRWSIYCFAILAILNFGIFGTNSFIYIQF